MSQSTKVRENALLNTTNFMMPLTLFHGMTNMYVMESSQLAHHEVHFCYDDFEGTAIAPTMSVNDEML